MMKRIGKTSFDVAVIGGGPAGISACLELSRLSDLRIVLFENESELGGIPRSAHIFFGMRDLKRIYTGQAYARKLTDLVRKTPLQINTESTVVEIFPGNGGAKHKINVASTAGMKTYESRFLILATGCYETSREKRLIPGARLAGIFTTGTLQKMVNLQNQNPGRRAVIIGSEAVAFSSALTLRHAGISIVGMVEEEDALQTYAIPARAMSLWMEFPIYKNTTVKSIIGAKRVEGVEIEDIKNDRVFQVNCDMVVITGKFLPDSALIFKSAIKEDSLTNAPMVNLNFETSVRNIFAAGNILRGANRHDLCALEGRMVAQSIMRRIKSAGDMPEHFIKIIPEKPIRHVVPQWIDPRVAKRYRTSWFHPGVSIQLSHTVKKAVLKCYSGNKRVWRKSYLRLIGNTTIPIPIEKFDWTNVDLEKGLTIRCTWKSAD